MDPTDKVKRFARMEGIDESCLILDEAAAFWDEHRDHGGYELKAVYDTKGEVEAIYLACGAPDLVYVENCSHQNELTPAEFSMSLVYERDPSKIPEIQAERRALIWPQKHSF